MILAKLDYAPVVSALRRAAATLTNTRPLMGTVAGIMARAVEDNFAQEGRPKWKDLAASTKLSYQMSGNAWKAAKAGQAGKMKPFEGRILQRSGQLAASIQTSFGNNTAVVGSNKVYAAIQQFGGRTRPHIIRPKNKRALSFGGIVVRSVNHPGSNIPARPFLKLTPGDLRDIVLQANGFVQLSMPK